MKTSLRFILSLILLSTFALQCKNPTEGINIEVDGSDIITYSAVFQVAEANGGSTNGLSVSVEGEDANAIYDLGGRKNYAIQSGMISFGVDPHFNPTANNPVRFEVVLKGEGFVTERIPVTIVKDQLQQLTSVKVMKIVTPPAGAAGSNTSTPLVGGSTSAPINIATPVTNGTSQPLAVTLPTGTKFIDATGKVIEGASLAASVTNFDASKPDALDFFPGGSLVSDNVVVGNQTVSATFLPAGFANIEMFVSGTQVKRFSQPIALSMGISSTYQNANTGQPVKAGDMLGVYSYETETGKWKFETNAPVVNKGGKLAVDFTTDHLTWFMTGVVFTAPKPTTTPKMEIQFIAPWLKGSNLPVTVNIYRGGILIKDQIESITHDKKVIVNGILAGEYKIEVVAQDKKVLYTGTINVPASHSVALSIEIVQPAVVGPMVSMNLKIQCPGKTMLITPPDFFLYYEEVGSTTGYQLLGLVKGGDFTTQLLDLNKRYHFKAVWGSKTKIVVNRKVGIENLLIANEKNVAKGGCGCATGEVTMFLQECNNL